MLQSSLEGMICNELGAEVIIWQAISRNREGVERPGDVLGHMRTSWLKGKSLLSNMHIPATMASCNAPRRLMPPHLFATPRPPITNRELNARSERVSGRTAMLKKFPAPNIGLGPGEQCLCDQPATHMLTPLDMLNDSNWGLSWWLSAPKSHNRNR